MISFSQVPNNTLTPFTFIELDNSRANQGPSALAFKTLMLGQKLGAGSAAPKIPVRVTSENQAIEFFGRSSMLHLMAKKYLLNAPSVELIVYPLEDDGAGVAATGSVAFGGTASASGVLYIYIAGELVKVSVAKDDTATAIGAKLVTSVGENADLPFTAVNAAGTVTLTAKNKGSFGNDFDIRQGYYQDEKAAVAGVTVTITAFASGDANPDLSTELSALPEEMYNVVICPYTNAANLAALSDELDGRWDASKQLDGIGVLSATGTHAELGTLGDSVNSERYGIMESHSSPTPTYEWAAAYGGVVAFNLQNDPARAIEDKVIRGVLAEEIQDRYTREERNLLLLDGISTHKISPNGEVIVERAITTYKLNDLGATDRSYLDFTTLFSLSYIRFDFRTSIRTSLARFKLASNGTLTIPGQDIITPDAAKAFGIDKAIQWVGLGIIESIDAFKEGLIVERNATDPNRLDWILTPDLMNQLRVNAVKIQFKL